MQLLQETQKQYKDNDPDEKVNELFKGDRRLMKTDKPLNLLSWIEEVF